MDKRKERRFKTRQLVKVCGKLGVINDVSSTGIQLSTPLSPVKRKVNICFEIYGKTITVMGVIKWIKRKQRLQSPNELGIVIKDAPPEYYRYVRGFNT